MTKNMAIGPIINVGGNDVQMTTKGKVQITNPKGKVITLSNDQFRKQSLENFDKIDAGENFEYKKDNKALKIAGAAAGTAAVVTGIIYRKEIGKFVKDFSFKKMWNKFTNLFKRNKGPAGYTKEFRNSRQKGLEETFKNEKDVHSRKTFAPQKDKQPLVKKQKEYMSEKSVQKRQERLAEIRKRRGVEPGTFFESGFKAAAEKFGW